jgi:hypothetical protein
MHLACAQERPKLDGSRLNEMSHKEIKTVPDHRDCDARAKSPRAVAARKNDDCSVNECLEKMKKPKLWNH